MGNTILFYMVIKFLFKKRTEKGNSFMYLYHATLERNKENILKNGLLCYPDKHNFDLYEDTKGCVFLAFCPECAIAYIEGSDAYEESDEDIICFRIDTKDLNLHAIGYDINNYCEDKEWINSITYQNTIPSSVLYEMSIKECKQADIITFEDIKDIDEDGKTIWDMISEEYDKSMEWKEEERE